MRRVGRLATVGRWFLTVAIDVCLIFNVAVVFFNVFLFPVCKAQLIGDWLENRQGAPNTIILLIIKHKEVKGGGVKQCRQADRP